MEQVDVLIVGGGPAGSTLAWALRNRGVDLAVLDRADFPRDKVCAGWITPAVAQQLRLDLDDYRDGRCLQPIHAFMVALRRGLPVRTRRSVEPLSYGIRRSEFDHYLLRRSAARLLPAGPLRSLERDGAAWVVNGEIRATLLVGAGGHFCPVARMLELGPRRSESLVAAQEIEFEMTTAQAATCKVDPQVPELQFCGDLAGYGWLFRKGDWLNVGLGREDPRDLPKQVDRFRESLIEQGRLPRGTPTRWKGHAYRLYPGAPCALSAEAVMLVGDAAGLAYGRSGEGIRPAIESALLAAEVIASSKGDYRRERLAAYDDAVRRRFGRRDAGRGLAGLLPVRLNFALARRLMQREWFVRRVVLDRWFLRTYQTASL